MSQLFSWDLSSPPISGSAPDPGTYVPSTPIFGKDARKNQFERGIKWANVPGGRADFVVHGGPRVYHVNSVCNLQQQPISSELPRSAKAGFGSSGYDGTIRFRRVALPSAVSPKEGRNLDVFGNENLFTDYQAVLKLGHILDSNTVGLWRFDEATGSISYDITSGSTAISYLGVPIVTGQVGYARYLTGSANATQVLQAQVTGSIVTQLQDEWTIEMWVSPNVQDAPGGILLMLNGLMFSTVPEDKVIFQYQINSDYRLATVTWPAYNSSSPKLTFSGSLLTPSTWNHVALSRVAQSSQYFYKSYVNGVLKDQSDLFNAPARVSGTANHYLGFGAYVTDAGLGNGGSHYAGSIDEVRLSKVVRTDAEILESYTRGTVGA